METTAMLRVPVDYQGTGNTHINTEYMNDSTEHCNMVDVHKCFPAVK